MGGSKNLAFKTAAHGVFSENAQKLAMFWTREFSNRFNTFQKFRKFLKCDVSMWRGILCRKVICSLVGKRIVPSEDCRLSAMRT